MARSMILLNATPKAGSISMTISDTLEARNRNAFLRSSADTVTIHGGFLGGDVKGSCC